MCDITMLKARNHAVVFRLPLSQITDSQRILGLENNHIRINVRTLINSRAEGVQAYIESTVSQRWVAQEQ
jgi:hypothetical protein